MDKAVFGQVEFDEYRDFLLSESYLYPTSSKGVYHASELGPFFKSAQKALKKLLSKVPCVIPDFGAPDEKILHEYTLIGHGKTGTNRKGRLTGWSGDMLCSSWKEKGKEIEGGIEQVKAQRSELLPLSSDLCFVSDLPRAIHHALWMLDYPIMSPVKDLLPRLEELAAKLSIAAMKKSVSKELYQELTMMAFEKGFIPTPLLRAQYYGPLELGPEKLEKKDKQNWVDKVVKQAKRRGLNEERARLEAEFLAEELSSRKELLRTAKDDEGNVLTENRTGLVNRIADFYNIVNKFSVDKKVLVVTSSGCLEVSGTYFRNYANPGVLSIENEPKQRGRVLEVKLGRFKGKRYYLNDSKLLDKLRERARNQIGHLRQLSIDCLVRDGEGIVEAPLHRIYDEDGEKPTELMEIHRISGPSISGVLDCERPVLIFGHGGQGKTILMTEFAKWILDNPKLNLNSYVPVIENCGDLNIKAKQSLLSGKSMYDYLCSSAEIDELPSTLLKKNKFVFLIDDYQKLNEDFTKGMEDAVQRLHKEGHKVIVSSRLEKPCILPPKVPGYTLFQINMPSRADSLDEFISTRLSDGERTVFQEYIQQYDVSVTGNYLSLAFLTMLFGKAGNNVLDYIQDEKITLAIREKQPLNSAQLYEALTDYVVGLDVERRNNNQLSIDDVRKETIRLKSLLGEKSVCEAKIPELAESLPFDVGGFSKIVDHNSHLQRELNGISLLSVSNELGLDASIKKNIRKHFNAVILYLYLNNEYHSFIHDTFREFFIAKHVFQQMQAGNSEPLRNKLSPKTLEFIVEMNPERDLLYNLIYSTRNVAAGKYGLLGGNCATLLAKLGEDLRAKDFSNTNLRGADLSDRNLDGIILKGADLKDVTFDYSNLNGVDVRSAKNVSSASFRQEDRIKPIGCSGDGLFLINSAGSLLKYDLKEGKEVMRSRLGKRVSASDDYLVLPNLILDGSAKNSGVRISNITARADYFLNLSTNRLLVNNLGNLQMYDATGGRQLFSKNFHDDVSHVRCDFSSDGSVIAVFEDHVLRILDGYSGDTISEEMTDILFANRIRISPDNRHVAVNFYSHRKSQSFHARVFAFDDKKLRRLADFHQDSSEQHKGLEWTIFSHDSKLFTAPDGVYTTESLRNADYRPISESKNLIVDPKFFTKNNKYIIFTRKINTEPLECYRELYAHEIATGKQEYLSFNGQEHDRYSLSDDGRLILQTKVHNGINIFELDCEGSPKMNFLKRIDGKTFGMSGK